MIIGSPGSGKSTLARRLHTATGLELIHLDTHFFGPNWEEPEKDVWEQRVRKLVEKENWIMDGNYGGTMDIRIARADTIVLMHFPPRICLWRVIRRIAGNYGKTREDMAHGCNEKFDLGFLWYVVNFRRTRGRKLVRKLEGINVKGPNKTGSTEIIAPDGNESPTPEKGSRKQAYILRSNREIESFLKGI